MNLKEKPFLDRLLGTGSPREGIEQTISTSSQIFALGSTTIVYRGKEEPRYVKQENTVYLPEKHLNMAIFDVSKNKLGEGLYRKFIAYHEFGHAVQVARLPAHFNEQVDIKGNINLNYLFNGTIVPNRVNNFMKELFKEGYADCYAGLCLYKETGDLEVFKKISKIRTQRYPEIKKGSKEVPPAHFIHPNFNIKAAEYLGKAIASLVANGKDVFSIPFVAPGGGQGASLEKHIERAVIAGSVAALLQELRTNDACLNHFRSFAQGFTLDQYSVRRILAGNPNLNQVLAYEKSQGISRYFLELKNRLPASYASILTDQDIGKVMCDTKYQRQVNTSLKLMAVVDIPYSSGVEVTKERIADLRTNNLNSTHFKVRKF